MTDSASSCGLMALNCNKAGMGGLDKEKINQIIEEASKGSKFYKKKQDDQVRIDRQVAELKLSLSRLRSDQLEKARKEADGWVIDQSSLKKVRVFFLIGLSANYSSNATFPERSCMLTWTCSTLRWR